MVITAIILFLILGFIYLTSTFWVQWWWFGSIGYQTALVTRYISAAGAFLLAGLIVGGFFAANWQIALRRGLGGRSGRLASSRGLRWPLWFCLAVVLVPLGQLVPLPPELWTALPSREAAAEAFQLVGRELPWMPVSLSPRATWLSALSLLPPVAGG